MPKAARVLLEDRISYRCLSVAARITRYLSPRWKAEFGLTVIGWRVMAVIGRFEPISATQLAARTSTDAFFVARAIEKLVEQGYVLRGVDAEDRRRLRLSLTIAGKKVHRQVEDMINQVEADLLAGIPEADAEIFFQVMSLLEDRAAALGTTA
ncbi:MarR family winged helix-turn-helix transcriptional regulator [Ramlibacter sp. AN1133]|uniref:MarR family winged helix-turn-helix transcriptional regulator n=1 Tax=Ramlibacter sp. AN1133 TaxID=3133429 RepID=UPI0030C1E038